MSHSASVGAYSHAIKFTQTPKPEHHVASEQNRIVEQAKQASQARGSAIHSPATQVTLSKEAQVALKAREGQTMKMGDNK